jgi:hypothetical protein
MKIVKDYPPNYSKIIEAIPSVAKQKDAVFTYGDTIFNPYGGEVQDHLEVHEMIHEKQQEKIGIEEWWNKFLTDTKFRLEQELEAYRAQYQFVFKTYGRANATMFVKEIAKDLSGVLYGGIIGYKQARKEIMKK